MYLKVFIILLLLTISTFIVGYCKYTGSMVLAILLLSVLIKGGLIIEYFMGLKDVQIGYRIIPSLWLLGVVILIFLAYFIPINA